TGSGDPRLEIRADGGGPLVAAGAERPTLAGRHQHVVALVNAVEDVGDAAPDALRRDAVLLVVLALLLAPAAGLGHGAFHRAGDRIGIEDHPAVDVARRAADGLDQRGLAAQKAFLVGVEDRDQRAFGN